MARKTWIDKAAEEIARGEERSEPRHIRDIIAKHHEAITKPEPGHIWDWAAACGAYLHAEGVQLSSHRIAAVVAHFAEPLVALLKESKREHEHRPDGDPRDGVCCPRCTCQSWPDDPEADFEPTPNGEEPCTCGADAWNAKVDAALSAK